jgi:hypothetical protein
MFDDDLTSAPIFLKSTLVHQYKNLLPLIIIISPILYLVAVYAVFSRRSVTRKKALRGKADREALQRQAILSRDLPLPLRF